MMLLINDEVRINDTISYTLEDGRKVSITFISQGNETKIIETFDAENMNPIEMQKEGWQAIINNYKKYTENNE